MISRTYRMTGAVIHALEKILKFGIVAEGLEHLEDRPTLFVVNHFTRIETFIIPYVLTKHTNKEVHSLADDKLCRGLFGNYLKNMGTLSVREPLRNRRILGDLITGRYDWVIYPEGLMVKTQKVMKKGKFYVGSPVREGPPHTGAAVLALKAEMYRRDYLRSVEKGRADLVRFYEERYKLDGPENVAPSSIVVVPVNITFYPLRPGKNLLSRLAARFVHDMPPRLEEELLVEGKLLFSNTDMTIYFGEPIEIGDYLDRPLAITGRMLPWVSRNRRSDWVVGLQKRRLTRRFMGEIYSNAAINMDHLFCMGLRKLRANEVRMEDFHRALYLSALTIRETGKRRTHPSLQNDLVNILLDEPYPPLTDIRKLACSEGGLELDEGAYVVKRENLMETYDFHDIRLKNCIRVIANAVEPLRRVSRTIDKYVNRSGTALRAEIVRRLCRRDKEDFDKDYEMFFEEGVSKAPSIGAPFMLDHKSARTGIVLCHGYLSAPEEVRPLAEFLHANGFGVYGVRLKGFGTAPRQVAETTWPDWLHSFRRVHAIVRNRYERVVLGGFSTGALLALLSAAGKKDTMEALFCINTPFILRDQRTHFAPATAIWNEWVVKMKKPEFQYESVESYPENPEINYGQNFIRGVVELSHLIDTCRSVLPEVVAPCLVVQGKGDPAVDPASAEKLFAALGSEVKKKVLLDFDRHVIIRNQGKEEVFQVVLDFLEEL